MLKVALGEPSRIEGFVTVDLYGDPNILWDLERGLPFESNSVEYIRANQVVEHMESGIRVKGHQEIGLYITNYYYQLWLYPGI